LGPADCVSARLPRHIEQVVRPNTEEILACLHDIHGAGTVSLSRYDGMYRGWGKLIAANCVARFPHLAG